MDSKELTSAIAEALAKEFVDHFLVASRPAIFKLVVARVAEIAEKELVRICLPDALAIAKTAPMTAAWEHHPLARLEKALGKRS